MFSCEFCEISKNTFFIEHVWATALIYHLSEMKIFFNVKRNMFFYRLAEYLLLGVCRNYLKINYCFFFFLMSKVFRSSANVASKIKPLSASRIVDELFECVHRFRFLMISGGKKLINLLKFT